MATDIAIFSIVETRLKLLLVERREAPLGWALPGGFLRPHETLDECARRELLEETNVAAPVLAQFANFSAPERDPRGWTLSVAYLALLPFDGISPQGGSDAARAEWFDAESLPPLAFDHAEIAAAALNGLRARLKDLGILFALLPQRFTVAQLQAMWETVAGQPADRRNFHSWVMKTGRLRETNEVARGSHRPARLYERAEDEGRAIHEGKHARLPAPRSPR